MNLPPAPRSAERRSHSFARALTIAANYLEKERRPTSVVADVRKLADIARAMEEAKASAPGQRFSIDAELRRIERQRTMFAMMPDSRARDVFKAAVIERARALLEAGDTEQVAAADALLEFMPSRDAELLLDEIFG